MRVMHMHMPAQMDAACTHTYVCTHTGVLANACAHAHVYARAGISPRSLQRTLNEMLLYDSYGSDDLTPDHGGVARGGARAECNRAVASMA